MILLDNVREVKALLTSYRDASRRALLLKIEIEQLRNSTRYPSSSLLDGMPRSHEKHDLSDYASKADALLRELQRQYNDVLAKKKMVAELIEEAPSENERLMLWLRYVRLEKDGSLMWYETIADKTGYSNGGVRKIINNALIHIAEKWPEIREKYCCSTENTGVQ